MPPENTQPMTQNDLDRLTSAVKALLKALQRSQMTETYAGTGNAVARQYRQLHGKIAEHLSDDYYVTDVLQLDIPNDADDKQTVSLVQSSASQLYEYLKTLRVDDERPPNPSPGREGHRSFGEELSDEIMRFTSNTIKRALSGIELDIDIDEPPTPAGAADPAGKAQAQAEGQTVCAARRPQRPGQQRPG